MKNKLFYLIGVAGLLSYTGTFTSCVNGVDDEYLEQRFTESTETEEKGEELLDINGDYCSEGDFELKMTCNGQPLDGKKVVMAVDENHETATITLAATETDLESLIGQLPGGVGGLIGGLGLRYTGCSPVPGEKEVTITNVPLFRSGNNYIFKGSHIQPTFSLTYKGIIEDEKMTIDLSYELTNQKLAGTWNLGPVETDFAMKYTNCTTSSPLWVDWKSEVEIDPGSIAGITSLNQKPNSLFTWLIVMLGDPYMSSSYGIDLPIQKWISNLLKSVTAQPNGGMYAIYSYSGDVNNPQWSSAEGMPHDAIRYYYDSEKPDQKLYIELNSGMIVNLIKGFITPMSRSTRADIDYGNTKEIGKQLIKLLVPILEKGIPIDYELKDNELKINIDGVVFRDILAKLSDLANDPAARTFIDEFLDSMNLGTYKENVTKLMSTLPNALKYNEYDNKTQTGTGECEYVKVGFRLVKE